MISRTGHVHAVDRLLREQVVVALVGARQVGKTTLARQVAAARRSPVHWLDLEDDADLARLSEPLLALRPLRGLVVLDEVQRVPDVFRALRVLADRRPVPARFLILGSASPELLQQGSETLAGRIAFHELPGLSLAEVGASNVLRLWLRGGFPRAYLARSGRAAAQWHNDFIRTFLERDLPQLGIRLPPPTLRRFWAMLAHWHGQLWNGSELGRAFGESHVRMRQYLDALTGALVLDQLSPWHANVAKRQVKAPKVYVSDTGLLHRLLDVATREQLERHPKVGASWEGFAMATVRARLGARREECFFWATHGGAELDLLVVRGRRRLGFEFKRTEAPTASKSMHVALHDLGLERITVVHAGAHSFPLAPRIDAVPLARVLDEVPPLR